MRRDLKQVFASRLKEELEKRRMSANALAKVSEVGQRSISRILRGEQDPTLGMVDVISSVLGLSAVEMLTAQGNSVSRLPSPYPMVFTAPHHEEKVQGRRKKRE